MNLSQLYSDLKIQLDHELEARLIIQTRTAFTWSDIITRGETKIEPSVLESIQSDLERRKNGEPISRIYGMRQFWGLEFKLSPDTLDPRPDTETLIEAVLKRYKNNPPETILDLGTGSGCILVSLLHELKAARGSGVDLSLGALETARANAKLNNVAERANFICGSWDAPLLEGVVPQGGYDLIVSNPPYISNQVIPTLSEEVQNHDPILALDGGDDGLDAYKNIFLHLPSLLNKAGRGFFEIGYDQKADMMRLSKDYRIRIEEIYDDLAGHPRVVEISCGDK